MLNLPCYLGRIIILCALLIAPKCQKELYSDYKTVLKNDQKDVASVPWAHVYLDTRPGGVTVRWQSNCFTQLFTDVVEHHAPISKNSVKAKASPWIDKQL